MKVKLSKWGNSHGIRLKQELIHRTGIDLCELEAVEHPQGLLIKKKSKNDPVETLQELWQDGNKSMSIRDVVAKQRALRGNEDEDAKDSELLFPDDMDTPDDWYSTKEYH